MAVTSIWPEKLLDALELNKTCQKYLTAVRGSSFGTSTNDKIASTYIRNIASATFNYTYTGISKNVVSNFCNNFIKCQPILKILSRFETDLPTKYIIFAAS